MRRSEINIARRISEIKSKWFNVIEEEVRERNVGCYEPIHDRYDSVTASVESCIKEIEAFKNKMKHGTNIARNNHRR